jgi:hypothetical protein
MATYLLAFHGGGQPASDAEREAVTAAWTRWFDDMGSAAVSRGNPTARAMTVAPDASVVDGGGANPVSGYAILGAESIEGAVALAQKCPQLASGGSVEVAEIFDIM